MKKCLIYILMVALLCNISYDITSIIIPALIIMPIVYYSIASLILFVQIIYNGSDVNIDNEIDNKTKISFFIYVYGALLQLSSIIGFISIVSIFIMFVGLIIINIVLIIKFFESFKGLNKNTNN